MSGVLSVVDGVLAAVANPIVDIRRLQDVILSISCQR